MTLLVVDRDIEQSLTEILGDNSKAKEVARGLHGLEYRDDAVGVLTELGGGFKCPRCGHAGMLTS